MFKSWIKKFFKWVLKDELKELHEAIIHYNQSNERLINILKATGIDVDVNSFEKNCRSESWACISIQGQTYDFVKFVRLGDRDIHEIHRFLKQFERTKNVDAPLSMKHFLKFY